MIPSNYVANGSPVESRNFGEAAFLPDGDKHELLKRIIEHYRRKIRESEKAAAKPQWLLRLGHLHLLALDWHLALSGEFN